MAANVEWGVVVLKRLKDLLLTTKAADKPEEAQHSLQLAAAVILIELSRADFQQKPEEQRAIEAALKRAFQLDEQHVAQLVAFATEENRRATSLYPFTRLINDHYSAEQKANIVSAMWEVAVADGDISKYEDFLIHKIAGLIYLPHSQLMEVKWKVLACAQHPSAI